MNKKPGFNSKLPLPSAIISKSKNPNESTVLKKTTKSSSNLRSSEKDRKKQQVVKQSSVANGKPIVDGKVAGSRYGYNRPAKKPAEVKAEAKVPTKPTKPQPPSYDYKTKFMLLKEEHIALKKKYEDLLTASENLKTYEEMEKKVDSLLPYLNDSLQDQNLIGKYDKLLEEYNQLKEKFESVMRSLQTIEQANECQLLKNLKLEEELKGALLEIVKKDDQICKLKVKWAQVDDMRRKLHDEIQCLKGNIRVFCRIRPAKEDEKKEIQCYFDCDQCNMTIKKCKDCEAKYQDMVFKFSFDHVFSQTSTQMDVFEELSPLIQTALDGYHVCIFAYGQTGSGKTYTMQGELSEDKLGIIPRSIDLLFERMERFGNNGWQYRVTANFLEIYNENIKDLLNPRSDKLHEIRYNDGRGISITNVINETIETGEGLKKLMEQAQKNRATAATNFNEHSSRSHAVTKIVLESWHPEKKTAYIGSLNFVDLAGSECAKTSKGARLAETKYINKSLSALGNVMLALYNKNPFVPYRNSKLTYMLQSSLGGNSKTLMVVNISPLEKVFCESLNSLRFASQVKEIKTKAKLNTVVKPEQA